MTFEEARAAERFAEEQRRALAAPLDLSTPSYRAAYALARELATSGDRKGATALMSRLLWHVESADGGFMGLAEGRLEEKCEADPRLNYQAALEAMYAPGAWPVVSSAKRVAA